MSVSPLVSQCVNFFYARAVEHSLLFFSNLVLHGIHCSYLCRRKACFFCTFVCFKNSGGVDWKRGGDDLLHEGCQLSSPLPNVEVLDRFFLATLFERVK